MMFRQILSSVLIFCSLSSVFANTDKVVCYHGTWSTYRSGNGKFTIEDIDPTLCTHIIYGFVGLSDSDGSVKLLDADLDVTNQGFARFQALKTISPGTKTLLAIGGWNEGSTKYSAVAASSTLRANFIKSAVDLLSTYGFDGFDLDWEYPAQRGGSDTDKENYVSLIREFREEFDKYGYLLTAAVAASTSAVDISYDVPSLSKYLDFINVMTYDLHGAWDGVTGENAPLYASSLDVTDTQRALNVDACIRGWIERGADPAKLIMGVGIYGRTFTLADASNNGIGAAITGPGSPGPYTGESSMVGYNEICELQLDGSWTVVWNEEQSVPYAYKDNQWVGYDNPASVEIKVAYAKSMSLGGIMVWSVETDDFRGVCGTKYPILRTINNGLGREVGESESAPAPEPDATTTTTTPAPEIENPSGICTGSGYVRDPNDCSKFYYCLFDGSDYIIYSFSCSNGLYYDSTLQQCNYAYEVTC
ncbi:chitinase [Rhyzopertha dominica]|nr:chitinase [Rhyzopertha dominica]